MTKRLLLLRHAQSDAAYEGEDKGRPLTPKGMSDALALGEHLRQYGLIPDYVLCSDAWRTRETLEKLRESFSDVLSPSHIEFVPAFYHGNEEDYLARIQSCDDVHKCVLVIGHYPNIPTLLSMLAAPSEKITFSLLSGYRPATLSVISCPVEQWKMLDPTSTNTLTDVITSDDYGAQRRLIR
ncbi:MAG: SixA phosphatase family protein [Alphaproteobacteria bacterium]